MATSPPNPEIDQILSILLKLFIAYTRSTSQGERTLLEQQILAIFQSLGASDHQSIVEARTAFQALRVPVATDIDRAIERGQVISIASVAREFASDRIRFLERLPANPKLSKAAREMLRIPIAEASERAGNFNEEQVQSSLDKIFNSIRKPAASEIEGDKKTRTSIAVIRALTENFCNIPPFCSGKSE